ncbi:MAG: hypothetical protein J3Q66DRAFT_353155 [Benniella sp.]|nr:MAG: hypothetical protein J3Q66DRAFT_353155 [Benniella sp.]
MQPKSPEGQSQRQERSISPMSPSASSFNGSPLNLSPDTSLVPSEASSPSPTSPSSPLSFEESTLSSMESGADRCREKSRSVYSSRSGTSSMSGSLRSTLSVRSFVGSMFQTTGKQRDGDEYWDNGKGHTTSLTNLKGIHGSKSESGIESFPSSSSTWTKRNSTGSCFPLVPPITACTDSSSGRMEEAEEEESVPLTPPPSSTSASVQSIGKCMNRRKDRARPPEVVTEGRRVMSVAPFTPLTPLTPISPM